MKITLKEAHKILTKSKAVIFEHDGFKDCSFSDTSKLTGIDENDFLEISWIDECENKECYFFHEGDNKTVEIYGCFMELINSDGQTIKLQLLFPRTL